MTNVAKSESEATAAPCLHTKCHFSTVSPVDGVEESRHSELRHSQRGVQDALQLLLRYSSVLLLLKDLGTKPTTGKTISAMTSLRSLSSGSGLNDSNVCAAVRCEIM